MGIIGSVLDIKEGIRDSNHEGELCQWHALVKVAEHKDRLEEAQPTHYPLCILIQSGFEWCRVK